MSANTAVFIDSHIDNLEHLLAGIVPGARVTVLQPDVDGITQITRQLRTLPSVEAVHILAHGAPGQLNLGNTQLGLHTLSAYAEQLGTWFAQSAPAPSLLLYGCNVAAGDAGEEFLTRLHQHTGAAIGASRSLVGSPARGGSWHLDAHLGVVDTTPAIAPEALATYPATLDAVRSGFDSNSLSANDDGSTGLVDIGFTIDFFGTEYSSLYVNNNGNLSFGTSVSTFTPTTINTAGVPLIAPFFADVDTSGSGGGTVTYGTGTIDGRDAFVVTWTDVGYYGYSIDGTEELNTFQVVIIDRSDLAPGAFDLEFNYDKVQWESGTASSGTNGVGGDSARVGFTNGTSDTNVELPGSAVDGSLLDGGSNALISGSLNSDVDGRYVFEFRSSTVDNGVGITVNQDTGTEDGRTTLTFTVSTFFPADGDQTVDLNLSGADAADFSSVIPSQITILNGQTSTSFSVTVADDALFEGLETATFTLSNPSAGLVLGTSPAVSVNLIDNDPEPPTNTAPTVDSGIANQAATEDGNFSFTVPGDAFADIDAGDSLTLTATLSDGSALPDWLSFDGTTFSGTPENDDVGTIAVTVTATDLAGEAVSTSFTLDIANTNDAPTVDSGIANQAAIQDGAFSFTVPGDAFADVDAGDSLTLTATLSDGSALPDWLSFNGTTFSGTPENDDVGTIAVTVTATDLAGEAVSTDFTLGVANVNAAPVFDEAAVEIVLPENSPADTIIYTASATDEDGDTLTYAIISGNDAGAFAINSASGEITVSDASLLNFETADPTYNLVIEAADNSPDGALSSTLDLSITLSDVGEHADFNGDGISDVLIQDSATGIIYVGISSADPAQDLTLQAFETPFGNRGLFNWTPEAIADMDGDGKEDDILLRNIFNGNVFVATTEYTDSGVQLAEVIEFGGTSVDWTLAGIGDFDGDFLQDDLVWYNPDTQDTYIWYSEGGSYSGSDQITLTTGIGDGWEIVGVGDFDTDARQDDLVFLNTVTGENYIWLMDGTETTDVIQLDVVIGNEELIAGLQVAGVGDFDNDLKADDILWQNTTADVTAIWYTEGGVIVDTVTKMDDPTDVTIVV